MSDRRMKPRGPLFGSMRPPGSKSITNRALLVAALAEGVSVLQDPLRSDDTDAMAEALISMGVRIERSEGSWTIHGGRSVLSPPADGGVDVRGSGTTARFVTALAALVDGPVTVDGSPRMRLRPIGHLVEALGRMGVDLEASPDETPPVQVTGSGSIAGGVIAVDGSASSQFVSAVMLIAPYADEPVTIELIGGRAISRPYLTTTAEVMAAFGVATELSDTTIRVERRPYRPSRLAVEVDASAAMYPWAAAAVTGGAIRVEGISRSSTQADIGALRVLEQMGCTVLDGPSGITVRGPELLSGVRVDMNESPDAVLAVAAAAALADGSTVIENVASLRVKESDRLAALAAELAKLGATASVREDSIRIEPGQVHGAAIDTYDDHRIAMAFGVIGLAVPGVTIRDAGCVAKTWPTFFDDFARLVEERRLVVAIDGPGGSGKTTVSRRVAERLGLRHLDTGAFYRAATLVAERAGAADLQALADHLRDVEFRYDNGTMYVDGRNVSTDIRSASVTAAASAVSAVPAVRALMVERQREWVGAGAGGAVVEGRDIGSVVFPEAAVKVFLTASEQVRAARRAQEVGRSIDDVADRLRRRDQADSKRAASPLQRASDAWEIDTSDLTIEQVVDRITATAQAVAARFS